MKYLEKYDVIVVGAGPAGSICALECAKRGLKVLVIDKRQEIGSPVRCAEGLSKHWFGDIEIEIDPQYCRWRITGGRVYSPSGKYVDITEDSEGYILERKIFEKKLAEKAINNGAHYMIKSLVYDLIVEDGFVKGVKVDDGFGKFEVFCDVVVAADGVDSKIARMYGIDTTADLSEVDSGFQYELGGLNLKEPNMIHIYVGNEIAPRGYVWIFPKSETSANVGIGIKGDDPKTAKEYLDRFIEDHPEIFKDAYPIEINCGVVPVGRPIEKPYGNGIVVIGDAARMVNPIHGGGIGLAMESGKIAAEVLANAKEKGDFSQETLKEFKDIWFKHRGEKLIKIWKARRFFEQLTDEDFEKLAEILDGRTIYNIAHGSKIKELTKLFVKYPRLLQLAMKTLF